MKTVDYYFVLFVLIASCLSSSLSAEVVVGTRVIIGEETIIDLEGDASAEIDLSSGDLVVDQLNDTDFYGRITGSGSVTKRGAASLTLHSYINTFSGGIYVEEGLLVTRSGSLLSDVHLSGGGQFEIFQEIGATFTKQIFSDSGGLIVSGHGSLAISNT